MLAGLFGCNQNKNGKTSDKHQADSTVQSGQGEHTGQLVLNDGKKWKLDEPTRIHINAIKQTVDSASRENSIDYNRLANQLQSESDKLVSDCKMTGKDHEMLHIWLEEFLSSLSQMKRSNEQARPQAFGKLNDVVKDFDNYFE
jgi:hypothetical protein